MNCKEENCLCQKGCEILGECVVGHELVKDYVESFRSMVIQVPPGKRRLKKILRILEAIKPYKVHAYQHERYYGLKTFDGIDLDSDGVSKKLLRPQKNHKNSYARKKRNEILQVLMGLEKPLTRRQLIKLDSQQ